VCLGEKEGERERQAEREREREGKGERGGVCVVVLCMSTVICN
jgi:hypothetical protein